MTTRVTRQAARNTSHRTAPAALDVTPPTGQAASVETESSSASPSPSPSPDRHAPKQEKRRTKASAHREQPDANLSTQSKPSTRATKTRSTQRERAHTLPLPNTHSPSNSHTQEEEEQEIKDQAQQQDQEDEEEESDATAAPASSSASRPSTPLLRCLCIGLAHVLPLMLLLLFAVFLTHPSFHSTRRQLSTLSFSPSSSPSFTHQALRTLQTFQQDFNTLYGSLLVRHTPHATNARIYHALDSIITRLADSFPVLNRETQDLLYYSLSAHFDPMQVKPARPLVLCLVEVQHRGEENEQQTVSAMVHQLSALLYPVSSVSPYLFDVSQLQYATAARIAAALDEQVEHHHNDSVVFFPRINSYTRTEAAGAHLTLRQVGELLQYYCDDALAPYTRVVYVMSLVFSESEWHHLPGSTAHDRVYDYLHEAMRNQGKEHSSAAEDKYDRADELIDAVLTRIVRNVIVLHTHV